MNFSSDAMADFEGLLEVNRKICQQQMAEKASPTLPTNCTVLPKEWYYLTAQQAGTCAIHATLPEAEIPEKFRAIRQRTKGTGEKQKV